MIQVKARPAHLMVECRKSTRHHHCASHTSSKDEFPEHASVIERLKETDYAFGRLAAAYEEVNRSIHHIETEEPNTDDVLEKLKKRRLLLKDYIAAILAKS